MFAQDGRLSGQGKLQNLQGKNASEGMRRHHFPRYPRANTSLNSCLNFMRRTCDGGLLWMRNEFACSPFPYLPRCICSLVYRHSLISRILASGVPNALASVCTQTYMLLILLTCVAAEAAVILCGHIGTTFFMFPGPYAPLVNARMRPSTSLADPRHWTAIPVSLLPSS